MLEGDSEFFNSDEIRASIDNLNKNFEKVPKITREDVWRRVFRGGSPRFDSRKKW